jgi:large subunit ribosomal protein L29
MKVKELKAMDASKRETELEGLLREQFNLRMQNSTGQLGNNSQLKKVRRDIARIKTVMNEQKGNSA